MPKCQITTEGAPLSLSHELSSHSWQNSWASSLCFHVSPSQLPFLNPFWWNRGKAAPIGIIQDEECLREGHRQGRTKARWSTLATQVGTQTLLAVGKRDKDKVQMQYQRWARWVFTLTMKLKNSVPFPLALLLTNVFGEHEESVLMSSFIWTRQVANWYKTIS